jgi:hypothetical protein
VTGQISYKGKLISKDVTAIKTSFQIPEAEPSPSEQDIGRESHNDVGDHNDHIGIQIR